MNCTSHKVILKLYLYTKWMSTVYIVITLIGSMYLVESIKSRTKLIERFHRDFSFFLNRRIFGIDIRTSDRVILNKFGFHFKINWLWDEIVCLSTIVSKFMKSKWVFGSKIRIQLKKWWTKKSIILREHVVRILHWKDNE